MRYVNGATRRASSGFPCHGGGTCIVPPGDTWIVDKNVDLEGPIAVRGSLIWDRNVPDLTLRACGILVRYENKNRTFHSSV